MRRNEREFVNTRARFQRLSDSKFFTGWVEDFGFPSLALRCAPEAELAVGDKFLFELYGEKANCIFIGTLEVVDGLDALKQVSVAEQSAIPEITFEFRILSEYRYIQPKESVRKAVQSLTATITRAKGEFEVAVSDVSSTGAGILTSEKFDVGELVQLRVTAMMRTITLQCQVRYSRADRRLAGMYRSGLQFENMNRVDVVSWTKVMDAA